jgi:hypothetical protein
MRVVTRSLVTGTVLVILAALLLVACDEDDVPPAPPEVSVRAEIVNGDAPFTASATAVRETPDGPMAHEVRLAWDGDDPVMLDDARFTHHVEGDDGDLVIAGRGCGAHWQDDRVVHVCTDDLQIIEVAPGEAHDYPVRIHQEIGPLSLAPGTYVVEEVIGWWYADEDDFGGRPNGIEGELTIRLTYEVE